MSFGIPVRNGLAIGLLSSTTLSSRRGLSPAMSLNFLQPFLDSRITFSRGSNATLVDATGKIVYAPANLLTYSEQFDNAAWTKSNTAVAPNVSDPLGGTTADTVTSTSANGHILQQVVLGAGINAIPSIWVRRRTGSGTINMWNAAGSTVNVTSQVTTSWSRVSVPPVLSSAGPFLFLQIVTSGDAIDVWGAQLEPVTYQTTPSTYVATTASAYYGPRFDYDPVTLAPKGLLIEEARTNLVLYSAQFGDAAWLKSVTTVTENTTVSPDGTANADTHAATASGAGAARQVYQIGKTLTAIPYTWSVYAKAKELNWLVINAFDGTNRATYFNLANGTVGTVAAGDTATIQNAGNGWYRCFVTRTAAATVNGGVSFELTTGDNVLPINANLTAGSGIFIYGAQLEAGSFATSYIPTVASTVTRSADVATMTGTNFSSWYNQSEGTFVADATPAADLTNSYAVAASDGSTNEFIGARYASPTTAAAFVIDGGVIQFGPAGFSAAPASSHKWGLGYKLNDFALSVDGATPQTDTLGTLPTINQLALGGATGATQGAWRIRQIAYYNTRLPNAQLQTLTAPSLATTLSLSFTNQAYTVGV